MERRRALCALGSGLTTLAGCLSLEPGGQSRESEADAEGEEDGAAVQDGRSKRARCFSNVEAYSAAHITLGIARDDVPAGWQAPWHVAVFTQRYPRGSVLRAGATEPITGFDGPVETVSVGLVPVSDERMAPVGQDREAVSADGPAGTAHHVAELRNGPAERPVEPGHGPVIAETNRFRVAADGGLLVDSHPDAVGGLARKGFSRTVREGDYRLSIRCRRPAVRVPLRVFRSAFVRAQTAWHGPGYRRYVEGALSRGPVERLTATLASLASDRDVDPLSLAIEVVQSLPYQPESVDAGADEHIKYPTETLVEGGGDCEDTAVLLASILQSAPYEMECALVHPPDHVGLGIAGEGFVGTYYLREGTEYFYVETTGTGWEIGELPQEYADSTAKVYPV